MLINRRGFIAGAGAASLIRPSMASIHGSSGAPTRVVIIGYGQSNMGTQFSSAQSRSLAPAVNANVFFYTGPNPPTVYSSQPNTIVHPAQGDIGDSIIVCMNQVNNVTGLQVISFNASVQGSSISAFIPGTAAWNAMVGQLNAILQPTDYVVMIWDQGEADAVQAPHEYPQDYIDWLPQITQGLASAYPTRTIPMLMAQIGTWNNGTGQPSGGNTPLTWEIIRRDQFFSQIVDQIPNLYFSHSNIDIIRPNNDYHYGAPSIQGIGQRFAQNIITLMGHSSGIGTGFAHWETTGAAIIDSTHTRVNVSPTFGTDFTPTTFADGWEVSGDNGTTWSTFQPQGIRYIGPGDVKPAYAWWGLRAYNNARVGNFATSPCIDIVDQAGANPLTVNCTPVGDLDVSAINVWVGQHSVTAVKIAKWYDQTGNGNDLTQATLANMATLNVADPKVGGMPCAHFLTASDQKYASASASGLSSNAVTFSALAYRDNTISGHKGIIGTSGGGLLFYTSGDGFLFYGGAVGTPNTAADFAAHSVDAVSSGTGSATLYVDGTATTNSGSGSSVTFNTAFAMGNVVGNSCGGGISEAGCWNSALSGSDALALNANRSKYWQNRQAHEGLVALRARWITGSADSTNKYIMSRSAHIATDNISALSIAFCQPTNGLTPTLTASIEYPAGTFTQITWNQGATSFSQAMVAIQVFFSDVVPVSIPIGATFWIRMFLNNATEIFYNPWQNTSLGEAANVSATAIADQTMGGTITNNATASLPPVAIVGLTTKPNVMLVGDSITAGIHDTEDAALDAQIGVLARSLNGYTFANNGIPSEVAESFPIRLLSKSSHLYSAMGRNNFTAAIKNDSASSFIAKLATMFAQARPGQLLFQSTITPYTTGSWTTLGAQTPDANDAARISFNDSLRAGTTGLPISGFMEIANVVESSLDSGKWLVTPSPPYTPDGLHPNTSGYILVQNANVVPAPVWGVFGTRVSATELDLTHRALGNTNARLVRYQYAWNQAGPFSGGPSPGYLRDNTSYAVPLTPTPWPMRASGASTNLPMPTWRNFDTTYTINTQPNTGVIVGGTPTAQPTRKILCWPNPSDNYQKFLIFAIYSGFPIDTVHNPVTLTVTPDQGLPVTASFVVQHTTSGSGLTIYQALLGTDANAAKYLTLKATLATSPSTSYVIHVFDVNASLLSSTTMVASNQSSSSYAGGTAVPVSNSGTVDVSAGGFILALNRVNQSCQTAAGFAAYSSNFNNVWEDATTVTLASSNCAANASSPFSISIQPQNSSTMNLDMLLASWR